jgi:hypothetical protein
MAAIHNLPDFNGVMQLLADAAAAADAVAEAAPEVRCAPGGLCCAVLCAMDTVCNPVPMVRSALCAPRAGCEAGRVWYLCQRDCRCAHSPARRAQERWFSLLPLAPLCLLRPLACSLTQHLRTVQRPSEHACRDAYAHPRVGTRPRFCPQRFLSGMRCARRWLAGRWHLKVARVDGFAPMLQCSNPLPAASLPELVRACAGIPGAWGLSIALFTVGIKTLTYPLNYKQM